MDALYRLILLLMLCCFSDLVFAQDYEDPEGLDPRICRFHENARREKCTKKLEYKNKSFPGCGFPSTKIQRTCAHISISRGRRRCLFSHRGKSSTSGLLVTIEGGFTAEENSWPWMVAIHGKRDGKIYKTVRCGASLISQKYVLTAAHCFKSKKGRMKTDPSKFSVVVGAQTRKDGTAYPVRQIIIHPWYKRPKMYHDIALIAVGRPVKLSKDVYPVCLPTEGLRDQIETDNVTVTGWGRTTYNGKQSEKLQEVTIPIVPLKECNAAYPRVTGLPRGITKQQICAGVEEGGKGSCHGDSGGPLVSKLKDNSYVQLGIVSFGYRCTETGRPTVYTKVSEYTKWIYDNTDLGK